MRAARKSAAPALGCLLPVCLLLGCLPLGACGARTTSLTAPSSAVHDVEADVYLVADLGGGGAMAKDGDGAIARIGPDGGEPEAWLVGGEDGVELHAPIGMAWVRDVLWVADVDVLRRFERDGTALEPVAIPGARRLHGVASDADGTVYVTDCPAATPGEAPGAVFRVDAELEVHELARTTDLGGPTGIAVRRGDAYCVGRDSGEFYLLDKSGVRTLLSKAPQAGLSGLVRGEVDDEPAWFATSAEGQAVFRFGTTGGSATLPARLPTPGMPGWDAGRRRLLVPLTGQARLHVEDL